MKPNFWTEESLHLSRCDYAHYYAEAANVPFVASIALCCQHTFLYPTRYWKFFLLVRILYRLSQWILHILFYFNLIKLLPHCLCPV